MFLWNCANKSNGSLESLEGKRTKKLPTKLDGRRTLPDLKKTMRICRTLRKQTEEKKYIYYRTYIPYVEQSISFLSLYPAK